MKKQTFNRKKIINDPVYGFIQIPDSLIFEIIEHPYFQRLRRIKQLGLTHYVYPGTCHTRFQHSLGAMHLMKMAIEVLKSKGHDISEEEENAVQIAILLHDIGHGPFSHALENDLITNIDHENLSLILMKKINKEFSNKLDLAIDIFQNKYHRPFFHELVSGQLDMDRLDYLNRDSFFSGVNEGKIGSDRIIKMLNLHKEKLVIESKGIYSIEKYLIARRLMYWQVYLHKTVLSAELILSKIFERVRKLYSNGISVFMLPSLDFLLRNSLKTNPEIQDELIENYTKLTDDEVFACINEWQKSEDNILSELSRKLITRNLFRIEITKHIPEKARVERLLKKLNFKNNEGKYFVFYGKISNNLYNTLSKKIQVLHKDKSVSDLENDSELLNLSVLAKPETKYYFAYPKELN